MKTLSQIDRAYLLATMRAHALELRKFTHPARFYGSLPEFNRSMDMAASYLGHAKSYRDMARNLGKWAKGGAA